jgi:hypothetical protein
MNTVPSQWASHDPGTLPWLAVALYLVAAGLCLWRCRGTAGRERWFWLFAGLALLVLGLNKELDLQTQLTALGRQMARDGGWYGQRRAFQRAVVIGGGGLALAAFAGIAWLVRGLGSAVLVTLSGLALLGLFVIVRAASFHHVDLALRASVFGLKLHTVLELAGIAIVILGALLPRRAQALAPPRPAKAPQPPRRPGYHR